MAEKKIIIDSLPEVPVIDKSGRKIFSRRCGTCANQGREYGFHQVITIKPNGRTSTALLMDETTFCDASSNLKLVNDDGSVETPPTGRIVNNRNFCGLWARRLKRP